MSLHIECENGHKLICPESLAGSSVICPKCGSRVDVSARNVAKGGRAFSEAAASSLSGIRTFVDTTSPQDLAGQTTSDEISFVCPNGHRLSGPSAIQGQTRECPKCKIKFRVPTVKWRGPQPPQAAPGTASAHAGQLRDHSAGVLSASSESLEEDDISLDEIDEIDAESPTTRTGHGTADAVMSVATVEHVSAHPIQRLIEMLWREREHGGLLELHLDDGVVIAPDWWSSENTTQSHGLFAVQADDGTYRIEAVAWPHIRRVSVRGLEELPGGIFDET